MFDWRRNFSSHHTFDVANSAQKGGIGLLRVPRVFIAEHAFARLQGFIDLYPDEIAGLGEVKEKPNGDLLITRIFLVDQSDNTGVHVDISDGVVKLLTEMDARDESPEHLRCRWHSHVNMEARFSQIDVDAAVGFGGDYLIDIVGNKRREFDVRLYFKKPLPIVIANLPLTLEYTVQPTITDECKAEIGTHVKRTFGGRLGRMFGVTKGTPPDESIPPYGDAWSQKYAEYQRFIPPSNDFGKKAKPWNESRPRKTEIEPPVQSVDKKEDSVVENPLASEGESPRHELVEEYIDTTDKEKREV